MRVLKFKEWLIEKLLFVGAVFSLFITIGIILILFLESWGFFKEVSLIEFFTSTKWTPLFLTKNFGVLPLLSGTLLAALIAISVALPVGLVIAIYLSEYAKETTRNTLKPVLEVLAAIPSIVYGYFALLFVTPLLQKFIPNLSGFNALSPGLVMGIMIIPLVSSLSEDVIRFVPSALREGAYALGSTRLEVALRVVVPAASPGIVASFILAISRAIGETMIVTIAAGLQPRFTLNPLVPIETMTAYIVKVSKGDVPHGTIEYQTIFVVGMVLFLFTFTFNTISHLLKKRFQEHYE
ncbi:MAG: Phosphate transport system permease protein PstC [candidate division WS2 bacterium]|nr:Phosphate transport system permease protein PstC [Candidatus Lithacetigena glycinireducens]